MAKCVLKQLVIEWEPCVAHIACLI
jgi:hypothetical protein